MGPTNHNLDAVAHYGADFIPDIIVSARGSELTTSNGTKILDWTSGQVSKKPLRNIFASSPSTKMQSHVRCRPS
jgi:hypothetical protein